MRHYVDRPGAPQNLAPRHRDGSTENLLRHRRVRPVGTRPGRSGDPSLQTAERWRRHRPALDLADVRRLPDRSSRPGQGRAARTMSGRQVVDPWHVTLRDHFVRPSAISSRAIRRADHFLLASKMLDPVRPRSRRWAGARDAWAVGQTNLTELAVTVRPCGGAGAGDAHLGSDAGTRRVWYRSTSRRRPSTDNGRWGLVSTASLGRGCSAESTSCSGCAPHQEHRDSPEQPMSTTVPSAQTDIHGNPRKSSPTRPVPTSVDQSLSGGGWVRMSSTPTGPLMNERFDR